MGAPPDSPPDPDARPTYASPIPLLWCLVPVVSLIGLLALFVIVFESSGHLPLALAGAIAGLVAWTHGWRWRDLQEGMLRAIGLAMPAILILLTIGMLMGTWLHSGVVPALIDWGLWLLSPSYFLPATCAVCSIVSLVSGSSWSTAGTVGLALIGVGSAMGIDPAMTAGAVISGAYFGDKLSPMSDTTNLAPAMAGTDLFTHIRHMLWTTGPSWIIAMIGFTVLGSGLESSASPESIDAIRLTLDEAFDPGIRHLIPPAVVALMVARKLPALPTLFCGALAGVVLSLGGGPLGTTLLGDLQAAMASAMSGFEPATGSETVDELLRRGGITSMSDTVLLVLCAMIFGGIMERTGQLRRIATSILRLAKSAGSMIVTTILTSIAMNILSADQYISVVVPGRMYAPEFRNRGLHPKNLSRALEDGGTITSPLIFYNTCGAYMAKTLGVATGEYFWYCLFNLVNPLIGILYGLTGLTIAKLKPEVDRAER